MSNMDADVIVIGSGFGGSVAALRYSEGGRRVIVLERGGYITRDNFEADANLFWQPEKGRYGMNELRPRGRHIIPWLGAGVGGGSHVYAGTLKRRDFFDDFPGGITPEVMGPYYAKAEWMMQGVRYPDHPPYNNLPAYQVFRDAEKKMSAAEPALVEKQGDILLAISYAPEGVAPGSTFTNVHGATQRYSDPDEQKLLGGEIEVKNTLDKNYLHLAKQHGAEIRPFTEVQKIEPLPGGGYRVTWSDPREDSDTTGTLTAGAIVCAAGAIGSTELLLRCKETYGTLPQLSDRLGKTYFTNGDFVTFLLPKKGFLVSWLGVIALIVGCCLVSWPVILGGLCAYLFGWWQADPPTQPDRGTTNSDYIRFRHRDGTIQGAYIEGGRYPTPIKAVTAIVVSLFGDFDPRDYAKIGKTVNRMGKYLPFFELLERSWPIPILMMGRDDAVGTFHLNEKGEAEIDFPFERNEDYIAYLNKLGRKFARHAKSYYLPNPVAERLKLVEVPHNMGGVSMGEDPKSGVVDSYGRVFGYENLLVLDRSIMPSSLGPNPACTILAFAERSLEKMTGEERE